jgi:hypothetical protein
MNFSVNTQENIQKNLPANSINTRNKQHLPRQTANLSWFQKSAFYAGIKIFSNLLLSLTTVKNEEAQFNLKWL